MYRTLKSDPVFRGEFSGACPVCGAAVRVNRFLEVVKRCPHFVRRWRVSADGRVRAEFRTAADESALSSTAAR